MKPAKTRAERLAEAARGRKAETVTLEDGREGEIVQETESGGGPTSRFVPRLRVKNQMPHDEYHAHGWINNDQRDAADYMHRLFVAGGKVGVKAASLTRVDQGSAEISDARAEADLLWRSHLEGLEPEQADIVWNVAGLGRHAREWAADRKYTKVDAMDLLRGALSIVAVNKAGIAKEIRETLETST